jgi:hypothetical protein
VGLSLSDEPLSHFASKFSLRRYNMVELPTHGRFVPEEGSSTGSRSHSRDDNWLAGPNLGIIFEELFVPETI